MGGAGRLMLPVAFAPQLVKNDPLSHTKFHEEC